MTRLRVAWITVLAAAVTAFAACGNDDPPKAQPDAATFCRAAEELQVAAGEPFADIGAGLPSAALESNVRDLVRNHSETVNRYRLSAPRHLQTDVNEVIAAKREAVKLGDSALIDATVDQRRSITAWVAKNCSPATTTTTG